LQQKLQVLCHLLSAGDADLVTARSSFYIEHMAGLCNQKALLKERGDTHAAKIAFQADCEQDLQAAIDFVVKYMSCALHTSQGPNARVGAVTECRSAVEQALAFPKPPEWSWQLDSFVQAEFNGAVAQPAGGQAKVVADQLNRLQMQNTAQLHQVNTIVDRYLYSKITTSWNVGGNQDHIQDKLQTLLPMLQDPTVSQQVVAQAGMFQQTMAVQRQKKLEEERAVQQHMQV